MTRHNKPSAALAPVRQALNAAGYDLNAYSDRILLRDYEARFIPRLPVGATSEEVDNAVIAAKLCAMARSGGHLCPVLGWRMLAMNPDPLATQKLRAAIRKRVENLTRHEYGPKLPKINVHSGKTLEALLPLSPGPVLEMVAHLARSRGISQAEIDTFITDIQEPAGAPDKRSPRTGLRDAFRIVCAEMGEPLTELSQKALEEAFLSSSPPARRLREFMKELGHQPGAKPSGDMVSLIDMVSTANLTDTDRALRLLADSDDDDVRGAVLKVGQARRTGNFPQEDHQMQRCRAAADWDALMTCQILDPVTYLWWKASRGDASPLLSFATEFLAEAAQGSGEEPEG